MSIRIFKVSLFLTILITVGVAWAQSTPSVSLEVSPTSGTLDDTFQLVITISGTQNAQYPELHGGEDFEISLIGPESSMQIINGRISAHIAYRYQLTPKRVGELKTPSATISINQESIEVQGTEVKVTQPELNADPASNDRIFFRQTISKDSLFLGEQAINTFEIYTRVNARDIDLVDPTFDGFWTQD
ncbi:MAG: BatD family protein, partial [Bdellovibrionales bacterium]|nr:BatD family protein [Bdellovibrionales bacterium]